MANPARPCGGVVFVVDTSANMLNGDYEPSRWDTQKSLVRSACDSIFAGFGDAQSAQAFFGLISTNGRNTGLVIPPCKGTYPQLMEALQGLSFDGIDGTVDLDRALKLHKLSHGKGASAGSAPRVVILTSSLPRRGSGELCKVTGAACRVDCVYLRGPGADTAEEEAAMAAYCADQLGALACLDPFDLMGEGSNSIIESCLRDLGLDPSEPRKRLMDFSRGDGGRSGRSRPLFPLDAGSSKGSRFSSRRPNAESCRNESLDTYQHLSSDGFAHSWLPTYSNLAKKYKDGLPHPLSYLVFMDNLCHQYQPVLSVRAGRMWRPRGGRGGRLTASRARGELRLSHSADSGSFCLEWRRVVGDKSSSSPEGLAPLCSRRPSPDPHEDEVSLKFASPSKVRFESVPCDDGEVLCVRLWSSHLGYRREPQFFWLQQDFAAEHGTGSAGLARKLEDLVRERHPPSGDNGAGTSDKDPILALGGSDKAQFESVLLSLMSTCGKAGQRSAREAGASSSSVGSEPRDQNEDRHGGLGPVEDGDDLGKGFYSWTAKLDAELTDVERKLAQEPSLAGARAARGMAEPPTTGAAPKGAEVNEEDSMLFELD